MKKPMIVTFAMAATMLLALATTGGPTDGTDDREMAYTEVNKAFTTMSGGTQTSLNTGESEASVTSDLNDSSNAFDDTNSMVISLENSDSAYLLDSTTYTYNDFNYEILYSADNITTYEADDPDKPTDAKQIVMITGYTGADADIVIPSQINGIPVTIIGDLAWNWEATSVVVPEGVVSIRDFAFIGSVFKSFDLPDSLERIGYGAFQSCINVEKITVPKNVTSIGSAAFADCNKLKSVTVDEDNSAFIIVDEMLYNKEMTELIFCPRTKSLPETITVPDGVETIDYRVFYGHNELKKVILPNSLVKIDEGAFAYCKNLQDVEFPDSLSVIGMQAFEKCALETVEIPKNTTVGDNAFSECKKLTDLTLNPGVVFEDNAFRGCTSLTEVVIPEGVETVTGFSNCTSLKTITLPSSLKEIGDNAFSYCDSLQEIVIPDGVKVIRDKAFRGCENLTEIVIPNGLETIGEETFYACSSLGKIIIPSGVINIGNNAFDNSYGLTICCVEGSTAHTYAINNDISYVALKCTVCYSADGIATYSDADPEKPADAKQIVVITGIAGYYDEELIFPSEINGIPVMGIADDVFTDNECLEKIIIPEGVVAIGARNFSGCDSLISVALPDSLKYIGEEVFNYCPKLKELTIPNGVEYIGMGAFDGTGIRTLTVPGSVKKIDDWAFLGCSHLTEVVINNGVEQIGMGVFGWCLDSLKKVVIPSSVTFIDEMAFSGCSNLTIYCVENSTAHTYAIDNNIPFVLIEETAITPGDINGDGVVDNKDLLLMRRYLADSVANALSADGFLAADISGDGEVNNQDLIRIRRMIAAN